MVYKVTILKDVQLFVYHNTSSEQVLGRKSLVVNSKSCFYTAQTFDVNDISRGRLGKVMSFFSLRKIETTQYG